MNFFFTNIFVFVFGQEFDIRVTLLFGYFWKPNIKISEKNVTIYKSKEMSKFNIEYPVCYELSPAQPQFVTLISTISISFLVI